MRIVHRNGPKRSPPGVTATKPATTNEKSALAHSVEAMQVRYSWFQTVELAE